MTLHFRFLLVASAATALSSCGTVSKAVNTAADKTMGIFRPKAPAEDEAAPQGTTNPADLKPGLAYDHAVMVVDINGGRRKIVMELRPDIAPKTVANFQKLVNAKFYDGLAFHRAMRGYLVQTGDPASRDENRRSEWGLTDAGYRIAPELKGIHDKGAIAMARQGPIDAPDKQASGSQFYIMLRSAKALDGKYSVFGKVTYGLEALEAIAGMTVDTNDTPTRRFEIKSVRLVPPDSPELQPERLNQRSTQKYSEKGPFARLMERFW